MLQNVEICQAFCTAVNAVKRNALSPQTLDTSHYLGGDLGIDSIEMLEIWFRIEKIFGIRIPDDAKRDVYTVAEVINVVHSHLPVLAEAEIDHV